jgi:hypothetical protein
MQLVQSFTCHSQTNQASTVPGHEIDHLRRNFDGRSGQVSLIFPVFIIHNDDHASFADILNGFFNTVESQRTPLSEKIHCSYQQPANAWRNTVAFEVESGLSNGA